MRSRLIPLVALATLWPASARPPINPDLYAGLVWRNIGPFRGGRVSAVTGVIGQPGTFYIGLPLGGVWKTTGAGTTWYPIMDDVKEASSVGSIQVAPSDPNIIYVGMGDLITGGGINEGNGVYKSTDAGKTWEHLGLDDSKQIPSILVDPKDPNLVLLAAQGNIHTFTHMRGVYRSTDGGRNWKQTLYVDSTTGAQEIAWAFDHPSVMLATTVRHYNAPGAGRGGGGGGGGGGPPQGLTGTYLFKSTDEGQTWKEISGHGLPAAMTGRTSIAVAINTNAQRMFLIGNFGFFRSDDGGDTWRQMAANDTRIRNGQNGYNCGVYVDPQNPDLVYTINTSSFISHDGGNTFTGFKGAPGGDDPQQMWIDPTNGKRMLLGVDQGATVSLDGGLTWSSWYNQATDQVYHISADNSYPYWVYATQQDAGSIATRSRGDLGAITPLDWYPTAGYEFGSIVADPLNPKIVYAGGPGGGIVKITYPSGQWINVSPNVDAAASLRKVGNQPILWSPTNPRELLVGFQYLMSTTDGGMHWKKLSPDLTVHDGESPPPPAPAGGRGGGGGGPGGPPPGSIESFSPSTMSAGIIWVGTNNGIVKLTRDHGASWHEVSIKDLPNPTRADISAIDASHADSATAYVAVDYHTTGDYTPYFYRTHDFGKTWTKIVNGMRTDQPSGSFARVIRADTKKAGLLFAGTESSMYVSFDDGDDWQSLQLNLPNTSYRDIVIKDNDLVVGTYGRSIWILDDYSPLRQMTPAIASEPAHLFKPGDAIRVRRNVNGDTPFPPEVPHALNPPPGVLVYYYLNAKPPADIALEVRDAAGNIVRHYSSAPIPPLHEPPLPVPDHWVAIPKPMPTATGTHRVNWDIRYDAPPAFSHSYAISANEGETPPSPEGPLALPGTYTIKLTVDGKSYSQTVTVKNDPRSPATAADLAAQHELQMKMYAGIKTAYAGYQQVAAARTTLATIQKSAPTPPPDVAQAIADFDAKLIVAGGSPQGGRGRGASAGNPGPEREPPAFATLNGTLIRQLETLDSGDMAPNEPQKAAFLVACNDLRGRVAAWAALNGNALASLNALLSKNNLQPVAAAKVSELEMPVCVGPKR
jgi:photosystem II stability/assembly factor-like uncharacterized protein